MARTGLLALHGDQRRPARARRALRFDLQPQLPRPAGDRRPHASCEPGDGGGRGDHRAPHRRTRLVEIGIPMQPFAQLTAIAAPIDEPNVDTNQLCPTRFNKLPRGSKYAQVLFHDRRFEADGSEKDFVLNREPYRRAQIVVADRNWGCGSSRESAVYALY